MLVYESGEALRFDETGIRAGVRGVTNVLRHLDMLPKKAAAPGRAGRRTIDALDQSERQRDRQQ